LVELAFASRSIFGEACGLRSSKSRIGVMAMKMRNGVATIALLALAACSQSEEAAVDGTQKSEAAPAAGGAAETVTIAPGYLAGPWCYLRYEAGGEVNEENINYVFAVDGTLKYQTNSSTPVEEDGSFEFKDGILKIRPALSFFNFIPSAVNKNGMILEAMGAQSFWKRGACGE
jgi:hypothetical protein